MTYGGGPPPNHPAASFDCTLACSCADPAHARPFLPSADSLPVPAPCSAKLYDKPLASSALGGPSLPIAPLSSLALPELLHANFMMPTVPSNSHPVSADIISSVPVAAPTPANLPAAAPMPVTVPQPLPQPRR